MEKTLAALVRDRINTAYGGNQAAFSRATGFSTQTISTWLSGKVSLPQLDARRRLARELGVSHIELLIAAGELTEEEALGAGATLTPDSALPPDIRELIAEIDWSDPEASAGVKPSLRLVRNYQRHMRPTLSDPDEVERKGKEAEVE